MLDAADGLSILERGALSSGGSERAPDKACVDVPIDSDVIAEADDYPSLLAGLIARRRELGLSQNTLDELAGLTSAYTSKLECPDCDRLRAGRAGRSKRCPAGSGD